MTYLLSPRQNESVLFQDAILSISVNLIFIYGNTGTGKTALITHISKNVKKFKLQNHLFIYCNVLRLSRSQSLLSFLHYKITKKNVPLSIPEFISKTALMCKNKPLVIVIDEIDKLNSGKNFTELNALIYHSQLKSQFKIVAISNNPNYLNEYFKKLDTKSIVKIPFKSFTEPQTKLFLEKSIPSSERVQFSNLINLVSKRNVARFGDLRTALSEFELMKNKQKNKTGIEIEIENNGNGNGNHRIPDYINNFKQNVFPSVFAEREFVSENEYLKMASEIVKIDKQKCKEILETLYDLGIVNITKRNKKNYIVCL